MITKLLRPCTTHPPSHLKPAPAPASQTEDGNHPALLRIIHAGGVVEQYYMAVPASVVIDKYPRAVLVRPDVFRRPLESLVRHDEILIPGEKFYVVPRRTLQKLQRRTRLASAEQMSGESDKESPEKSSSVEFSGEKAPPAGDRKMSCRRKRRVAKGVVWKPSLMVIDEASPLMAPPPPPCRIYPVNDNK